MADKRARLQHEQGWSALTRKKKPPKAPLLPSFSRELGVPDPSQFTALPLQDPPANAAFIPSFAHNLKQEIQASHGVWDYPPPNSHSLKVARLHTLHHWADPSLISDILHTLDSDEDRASVYLFSMFNDDIERVSAYNEVERPHGGEEGQFDTARVSVAEGAQTFKMEMTGRVEAGSSVPVEPEWEEQDIYLVSRKEAMRMSRASGKHSRGAYKAFMDGDYSRAKILSKQAREERVLADRFHAEAAKQIFQARNGQAQRDMWHLDLHGLHVGEAIAALQQRLSEIEATFFNPHIAKESSTLQGASKSSRQLQGPYFHEIPFNQELKVITGVGNHSRSGGSLPMAIKGFLIQNRYKFEESKPGVVAVCPKFQFMKDK